MKNKLSIALVIIVVLLLLGSNYLQSQRASQLVQELREVNARIDVLQRQVVALEDEVARIEKTSVSGLVDNANQVLVEGWAAMLESVERELRKARERARGQQSQKETR